MAPRDASVDVAFHLLCTQILRGVNSLPYSMAQPGSGPTTRSPRISHFDDRGTIQGRRDYVDLTTGAAHPEMVGRPDAFVDGTSLISASTPTYEHANTGLSTHQPSQPSFNIRDHSQDVSQALGSYGGMESHQAPHYAQYTQYAQTTPHIGQMPQIYHHQHYQQPSQQQAHQHYHHPHFHHVSEQHLGVQVQGEMGVSPPLGVHQTHMPYGVQAHSSHRADYGQSSLDGQRKGQREAEPAEPHTPRPPNAWILYRSQKFREIQQQRDAQTSLGSSESPKSQAEISRIISQMWQNETAAVKQRFEALADEKKLAHQRMYPTYRYRPKKKAKNSKQNVGAAQTGDKGQATSRQGSKSALAGGNQDRYAPEASTSAGYPSDRRGGSDPHRPTSTQSHAGLHDIGGRATLLRNTKFAEQRERGDLSLAPSHGRSVSRSVSSGEGQSTSSYGSSRMHPYGDRSSSFLNQENPRPTEVFGEQSSGSGSATFHWADPDAVSRHSRSGYFDGARPTHVTYGSLGTARAPGSSLMGPDSVGSGSLVSLSPSQSHSVASQQLQHPSEQVDNGNIGLAEFTGAGAGTGYGTEGGSFRTTPMGSHGARFGASFEDPRSELPGGMGSSGPFDPQRR